MKITSCNEYKITLTDNSSKKYTLSHLRSNAVHFQNPDTKRCLKIYIFIYKNDIIYVGTTNQPMSVRLNYGLNASGIHGYHGYKFKNKIGQPLKLFVSFY